MRIRYWMMRPAYAHASRERGGFIYVVNSGGMPPTVKIGISSNPSARIAQLRTASTMPLAFSYIGALNCSGFAIESAAHRTLARYRITGEWFNCTPEIAIAAISVASSRLGEPIASVDPGRVDEIAAAVSWGHPWSVRDALTWCYIIILVGLISIAIIALAYGKSLASAL
jgi:hypothetical protein